MSILDPEKEFAEDERGAAVGLLAMVSPKEWNHLRAAALSNVKALMVLESKSAKGPNHTGEILKHFTMWTEIERVRCWLIRIIIVQ